VNVAGRGRPLRFVGAIGLGWIGLRAVLLLPGAGALPSAVELVVPQSVARAVTTALVLPAARAPAPALAADRPAKPQIASPSLAAAAPPRAPSALRIQMALLGLLQFGPVETLAPRPRVQSAATPIWQPDRIPALPDRWGVSAWLVARPGTGIGAAPGGSQIGGSQGGVRLSYLIVPRARIAAFARAAAPLTGRGAEATAGIEWQPGRAPVRLVAEHRIGLDGVRSASGIGAIAGIDTRLPAHFRLEGYGQAGMLWRGRSQPYADGSARVTREVASPGGVRLAVGMGTWGAAQRDARRLDLGPSVTIGLGHETAQLRVAIDWRQRVAGNSRPGSGLALTLGTDF
jgi:hypothetical protein